MKTPIYVYHNVNNDELQQVDIEKAFTREITSIDNQFISNLMNDYKVYEICLQFILDNNKFENGLPDNLIGNFDVSGNKLVNFYKLEKKSKPFWKCCRK